MSDQLAAAAQALNAPEAIVKRSAEARAKASGLSVEEVLTAWAGGASVAGPVPAAPATAATAPPAPAEEPAAPVAAEPTAAAPPTTPPPTVVPPPPPLPRPTRVSPAEAVNFPVVVTVPTAELVERTDPSVPRWLAAISLLVSVVGLLYLAGNAQGVECGSAGVLAVDRQSGEMVNCDGSKFEGRGTPGSAVDFLTLGQSLYLGQAVSGVDCAGCHLADGSGGNFPVLSGGSVLATFSKCADHVEWVRLGTNGWPEPTYGDPGKRVGGSGSVMPSFGGTLSEEQLRSVVLFERVVFGGTPEEEAEIDCGLVAPPEGEEGEAPAGEAPQGVAPAGGQAETGEAPAAGTTAPPDETTTTPAG